MITASRLLTILVVLFLAAVIWDAGSVDAEARNAAEYVRYALFAGLSALIVLLCGAAAYRSGSVLQIPAGPALLLASVLYTCLSAAWSANLATAGMKAVLIATALAVTLAISAIWSRRSFLTIVVVLCALFVAAGAVVALAVPSIGVETGWLLEGKWRGLSSQKNGYGALAALAVVGIVILSLGRIKANGRRSTLLPLSLVLFFVYCLLMSGSRGGQFICAVGLASAGFLFLPARLRTVILLLVPIVAVPLVPLGVFTYYSDATQLGIYGMTFDTSSRTTIWAYGLKHLSGQEFFGYGLSGFWTPERLALFKRDHGWVLDNFHNGYLTVLIEGGLVGIALLISTLVANFMHLYRRALTWDRYDIFGFSVFCMIIAHNFMENDFGRSTDLFFLLYLAIAFSLVRRVVRPKPRRSTVVEPLFARPGY